MNLIIFTGLMFQPFFLKNLNDKTTHINSHTGVTEAVKWKEMKRESYEGDQLKI